MQKGTRGLVNAVKGDGQYMVSGKLSGKGNLPKRRGQVASVGCVSLL